MTRKDYQLIANTLAAERAYHADLGQAYAAETVESVAARLADELADDNPRFDRERFLKACGVGE